jgi:hypothetical protein
MLRWVTALVPWLVLGATGLAQPDHGTAPGSGAGLSWTRLGGAAACIDRADLAERVEGLMDHPVWNGSHDAGLTVDGWVAARPAPSTGFVAGVTFLDPSGVVIERDVIRTHAANCRVIDEALARMIARTLAVHPLHAPRRGAVPPTPDATTLAISPPSSNPYLQPVGDSMDPDLAPSRRSPDAPPPNPYTFAARPEAHLETHFNPYLGTALEPTAREVSAGPAPAAPLFNPYVAAPSAGVRDPHFNPYRP